jgi:hypothetical protein
LTVPMSAFGAILRMGRHTITFRAAKEVILVNAVINSAPVIAIVGAVSKRSLILPAMNNLCVMDEHGEKLAITLARPFDLAERKWILTSKISEYSPPGTDSANGPQTLGRYPGNNRPRHFTPLGRRPQMSP